MQTSCQECTRAFYHDLPAGHSANFPVIIDTANGNLLNPPNVDWFSSTVTTTLNAPIHDLREFKVLQRRPRSNQAIVLNCLDGWYGHVLLKLFNADMYKSRYPQHHLIVIIPENFSWMIPELVDETWTVPAGLAKCKQYYLSLDRQFRSLLSNFGHVYLSIGNCHPLTSTTDVTPYFKTAMFPIGEFAVRKPVITFIYREDRPWIPHKLERYRSAEKRLPAVGKLFLNAQLKRITQLYEALSAHFPDLQFNVAGLGKTGRFPPGIRDFRVSVMTTEDELTYCALYAESQVVIGIHGSNMLIPSALAAGWVELLPADRLGNITQDLFYRYQDRLMSYMGRFVPVDTKPGELANLVLHLIDGFESFRRLHLNIYDQVQHEQEVAPLRLPDYNRK